MPFTDSTQLRTELEGARAELKRLYAIKRQTAEVREALTTGSQQSHDAASKLVLALLRDEEVLRKRCQGLERAVARAKRDEAKATQ